MSEDLINNVPDKRWRKGQQVRGQYDVSAVSYSTGHCLVDLASCNCKLEFPMVSIHNIEYEP